ncbi:MAG TPA: PHP domain-containing protein [Terriglobia bacterium]|nr:PHP domain-containing protein [Terriglobia bacterium]
MKCDMHVHSIHSGPLLSSYGLGSVCRECYSPPEQVYDTLRRRGLDLITLTDHDSIDGGETLRGKPGFFLSEEVTCLMPSGNELHLGVYDLAERQHIEIHRRRTDLASLLAYLEEQNLFFSVNHPFSTITGKRAWEDFVWFASRFPALETLNGHLLVSNNGQAAKFAHRLHKACLGGSDAHTLTSAGSAYTLVPGARNKAEFFEGLRMGRSRAGGHSGGYWKLTRDAVLIMGSAIRERPYLGLFTPLALLIPVFTLVNHCKEAAFARRWKTISTEDCLWDKNSIRQPLSSV